jgi:hypothetical protein
MLTASPSERLASLNEQRCVLSPPHALCQVWARVLYPSQVREAALGWDYLHAGNYLLALYPLEEGEGRSQQPPQLSPAAQFVLSIFPRPCTNPLPTLAPALNLSPPSGQVP